MTSLSATTTGPVHVIGATGRSGAALCAALGAAAIPVVRNPARWTATGAARPPRVADLTDPVALRAALADASAHVSPARARHTGAVIPAAPPAPKLILLGSTRKFTR